MFGEVDFHKDTLHFFNLNEDSIELIMDCITSVKTSFGMGNPLGFIPAEALDKGIPSPRTYLFSAWNAYP